ncbi:unnamed protein product [Anisakis simplex]|uniref:Uncharacterized protein n=1 Tax=Anisakis simplex TaxID=6269 RepID=A0A3P6PCN4_ANISI|nr:unnamed protein product [Anisakis simplex]
MHFMLKPCAWENVDLLEAICNAVPSVVSMLNPTGSRSETPLMTARRLRQKRMVCTMQRLCRASNVPVEIVSCKKLSNSKYG